METIGHRPESSLPEISGHLIEELISQHAGKFDHKDDGYLNNCGCARETLREELRQLLSLFLGRFDEISAIEIDIGSSKVDPPEVLRPASIGVMKDGKPVSQVIAEYISISLNRRSVERQRFMGGGGVPTPTGLIADNIISSYREVFMLGLWAIDADPDTVDYDCLLSLTLEPISELLVPKAIFSLNSANREIVEELVKRGVKGMETLAVVERLRPVRGGSGTENFAYGAYMRKIA